MALGGSKGWDFTMTLGEAVPLHPHISGSISLHSAHLVLPFFLSHRSTTHVYTIVAPTVSRPRGGPLNISVFLFFHFYMCAVVCFYVCLYVWAHGYGVCMWMFMHAESQG